MNTIEDRLREALRERAAQSPVDPDAWTRTVSRVRRPARARTWSRVVIPLAAAAAVVAIVVGATVLTRGGAGRTGTSPTSSSLPAGAPAPPGPSNYEIKEGTVVSAIVPVKLTFGKHTTWTFVWFSRPDSGSDPGLQVCMVTDGDGFDGSGGCNPVGSPDVQGVEQRLGAGPMRPGGDVQTAANIAMLVSDQQVTSVTARLSAGGSGTAASAWGRGFPDKVWLVGFPDRTNVTVVMRNAAGKVLKQSSVPGTYPIPSRPRTGGIELFSFPARSLDVRSGTMTAYLVKGSVTGASGPVVLFWGSDGSSSWQNGPASGPPAVQNLASSPLSGATVAEFFGYAHANVARVVLRLPDGRQYGAQTTAGWPGSGLRLWHFAIPVKAASYQPGKQVLLGYNAAGQVVFDKLLEADS